MGDNDTSKRRVLNYKQMMLKAGRKKGSQTYLELLGHHGRLPVHNWMCLLSLRCVTEEKGRKEGRRVSKECELAMAATAKTENKTNAPQSKQKRKKKTYRVLIFLVDLNCLISLASNETTACHIEGGSHNACFRVH